MRTLKTISTVCYALVSMLGLLFAGMYLLRPEFMPYHADALEVTWDQVDPAYQVLILALMRVSGGGWLGVSLAILFLLQLRSRKWSWWTGVAIVVIGLAALVPSLYATLMVKFSGPADPPWMAATAGIVLLLVGLLSDGIVFGKIKNSKAGKH